MVECVCSEFDVFGIVVVVVKDGKVVFECGYGVCELGKFVLVQVDMLFVIVFNIKVFIVILLNLFVEQGRLKMDDWVIDYLFGFCMFDLYVIGEMCICDLFLYCSGLSFGVGDLLFWLIIIYINQEVVQCLVKVLLKVGFCDCYVYDNIFYVVVQQVIEQVFGQFYVDFLQQYIFMLVGMIGMCYNVDYLQLGDNVVVGYVKYDFIVLCMVVLLIWFNNVGVGGIYFSVYDMVCWMNVQLVYGMLENGIVLFSVKIQNVMWQMIILQVVFELSVLELVVVCLNFVGYGEGWSLSDYWGQKLVWYIGGWLGMVLCVILVFEQNLGIVVLINQEVGVVFNVIMMDVLDVYFVVLIIDWVGVYVVVVVKVQDKVDEGWVWYQVVCDVKFCLLLLLVGYVGGYCDLWYGDVFVEQKVGMLCLCFGRIVQLVGMMELWQYDIFLVCWDDCLLNVDVFIIFSLDLDGKVCEVCMQVVLLLIDFSFDFQDLLLMLIVNDVKG